MTLAVVGGGEQAPLPEAAPERLHDPLPPDRPVTRADIDALRFPLAARGYRMSDVDDALNRLAAELAERDARIADLESALTGARAAAVAAGDGGDIDDRSALALDHRWRDGLRAKDGAREIEIQNLFQEICSHLLDSSALDE